jgi:crotonobetainyl-CoA:carnitine CoA-transferase CaiB-like acyl-CoA transferase
MSRGALENITVADFGSNWAGPLLSRILADMGATVIKIESWRHMDLIRSLPP